MELAVFSVLETEAERRTGSNPVGGTKNKIMVDYVLVLDIRDNGLLCYYCGYSNSLGIPKNSTEYKRAMKIAYMDEAIEICEQINKLNSLTYHVEEHMYM